MKNKLLILFSIALIKSLFSQGLEIDWQNQYTNNEGWLYTSSLTQTYDEGYLIVSGLNSTTETNPNFWIIKTNLQGNIEWEKELGGSEGDFPCCVVSHIDGTHIVGGNTYSDDGDIEINNGTSDIWIIKLDVNGEILWQRNYGGSNQDFLSYITKTSDGGYILGGGSIGNNNGGRDVWLIKIDSEGIIEWSNKYGFTQFDDTVKIIQTSDGGYIIGAITSSNYQYDFWIFKISANGEIEWSKILGGTQRDDITDIQQLYDGGFIASGWSLSNDGDITFNYGASDIILVRLNANGEILWIKNYGGSNDDKYPLIQITNNNTILMAAYSLSNDHDLENNGEEKSWNVELDFDGNIIWDQKIEGKAPTNFEQTLDGGYVLLDGRYILNQSQNNHIFNIKKFYPYEGNLILNPNQIQKTDIIVYPNPSKGHITINSQNNFNILGVKIFDSTGKFLQNYSNDSKILYLNLDFLKSGIYYLEISTINEKQIKKLIIK